MAVKRETFTLGELETCLPHYHLGTISSIKPFARGSYRSPKMLITSSKGRFLFKRRARGKDDAAKVAFAHQIQLALSRTDFPLPRLIPATNGELMLTIGGRVHEMFEFIEGGAYDRSSQATFEAGRTLGTFHVLLSNFRPSHEPPRGSYHDAHSVRHAIDSTTAALPPGGRPAAGQLKETVAFLRETYDKCAEGADACGLRRLDVQVVHGDWHPGNLLFQDRCVVAVFDYDSAKAHQRVIDLANAALQFSIIGGRDPDDWPEQLDENRLRNFVAGYRAADPATTPPQPDELRAIPMLMCQAMIAETVTAIAGGGAFGRLPAWPVLQAVHRKTAWILDNPDVMAVALAG